MNKKISFAGPWITQKEVNYVTDAVLNGWYSTYDMHTKKLEAAVCSYLGVKHAIATHCCTLALHLAAASLGLTKGDEVIVTDHSWVATAYAVAYTGATCVFVDIDPTTLCIDPAAIKKAITPKTKAIMLVHNFGQPAEMDEIIAVAKEHKLKIIEDAAPALGAIYKGQKVGTYGDIACFSFQGAKLAVSGEGGVFVTNDDELYQRGLLLSSMGRTDRMATFWSDEMGFQYTISNLSAALALAQVERVEELLAHKREIFSWYEKRLGDQPGITLIREKPYCRSNYCYPSLWLEDSVRIERDEILRRFRDLNIHCRPGFPRMSLFPVFADDIRFDNPVAERFEKRGLVLASAADLTENDIDFVCENLIRFINE